MIHWPGGKQRVTLQEWTGVWLAEEERRKRRAMLTRQPLRP
jgi:hypothetical protein